MSLAPAAISIIFNENDKQLLLVKRHDVPVWVLPGGGIDQGETPEIAVRREVFEETGYRISIIRQTAEYHPINRLAALTYVFLCRIEEGEPQTSSETASIAFFSLQNLPKSLLSVHRDWLNDALTHSTIVKKPLTQVTYWAVFKHLLKHPMHVLRFLWTRLFKK